MFRLASRTPSGPAQQPRGSSGDLQPGLNVAHLGLALPFGRSNTGFLSCRLPHPLLPRRRPALPECDVASPMARTRRPASSVVIWSLPASDCPAKRMVILRWKLASAFHWNVNRPTFFFVEYNVNPSSSESPASVAGWASVRGRRTASEIPSRSRDLLTRRRRLRCPQTRYRSRRGRTAWLSHSTPRLQNVPEQSRPGR
jgi:hypothetical protein